MTVLQKRISIFYSWQSDIIPECNWKAISQALAASIPTLEAAFSEIKVYVDEATRDLTGSPNIPASIFEKIASADIFVCDITTINSGKGIRSTPNPNVLVELGYAVALVGWPRIILVFNKNFGKFPSDVPFDIDRHRITDYTVKDKADLNGKGQLRALLTKSLEAILRSNPPRPTYRHQESVKRERDIKVLTNLFSNIYIPLFDQFLADAPGQIDTRILHYWHGFDGYFKSSHYHLHDKKAHDYIKIIHESWEKSLSFDHLYRDGAGEYIQLFGQSTSYWAPARTPSEKEKKHQEYISMKQKEAQELPILEEAIKTLRENSKALLDYIHDEYLEIDLNETSKAALENYKSYQERE